jgi:hypothetical protein
VIGILFPAVLAEDPSPIMITYFVRNPFAAEGAVASGLQVIDDVWFKLAGKPSEKVHESSSSSLSSSSSDEPT